MHDRKAICNKQSLFRYSVIPYSKIPIINTLTRKRLAYGFNALKSQTPENWLCIYKQTAMAVKALELQYSTYHCYNCRKISVLMVLIVEVYD